MKRLLLPLILLFICSIAHPQPGTITNIRVSQRTDGSGMVDVFFDLIGEANAYNVLLEVSFNGSQTYAPVSANYFEGDTEAVRPGEEKQIVWNGQGSFPNTFSTKAVLKIIAMEAIGVGIPCPGMPSFTDPRDGNVYNTVQIGNQCWLKENLKYLPEVSPPSATSSTESHYHVYGYEGTDVSEALTTDNYKNYGVLYNWHAAMNGANSSSENPSGVRGVCPVGWHLPSDDEWTELTDYVASQGYPDEWGNPDGASKALKSCRQDGSPLGGECATSEHPRWNSNDTDYGADHFGFSALPGGVRTITIDDFFIYIGGVGFWYSSTENSSTDAWHRRIFETESGAVYRYLAYKESGLSVRCVRDE
jgi:uncharacterized protein (TIGR02145 family)